MTKEELKAKVYEAIDRRRDEIVALGETIMKNPELGFKEFETAALVREKFASLDLPHRAGLAITGVKAKLESGREGPTVALIGELDALIVASHPQANPGTGAAHACGHNAQIAGLVGAAMGLADAGAIRHLGGDVVFFAVPAEEYVEVEYRSGLMKEGKIEFLGGKPELIRLGEFDDVDMAMMIHTSGSREDRLAGVADSSNGCIVKQIRYIGKEAHAGGAPDKGINALYAAHVGLAAINALRETFRDQDSIRVHPIITRGGDLVNVIPADVRMETYVRGKTTAAIQEANRKVDRALRAGALALGAQVEIATLPGYFPLKNDPQMAELFKQNILPILGGEEHFARGGHRTGSTDMGDVSYIMPALHPFMAGATGSGHTPEWHISDPERGYLWPAKSLAAMAIDLLYGDAGPARKILETSKPEMTNEDYLAFQRNMKKVEVYQGE
ncbi:MAG: amidohydrolase [Candidatus Handelsmanbacteria bacterium RIFCSPLOWO2_12_FULL_64_10]|uniref:Peptidase M20 domain-containing protein 2 n=1 Tax=Handelsmanbacteria sp. (strain RIFCSPLOWO2_12_FULL_64_10) TaxID=1817868 RepID=A0A1F6C3J5_HANXR|nr:MAG: amidohydrolase [Candidatus Handelsmanbacteria bacterium RIFCSPLOWO2_12_FULL_64_10]